MGFLLFAGILAFETDLIFVIGRKQLLGADDVRALAAVMANYRPLMMGRSAPPPLQAAGLECGSMEKLGAENYLPRFQLYLGNGAIETALASA